MVNIVGGFLRFTKLNYWIKNLCSDCTELIFSLIILHHYITILMHFIHSLYKNFWLYCQVYNNYPPTEYHFFIALLYCTLQLAWMTMSLVLSKELFLIVYYKSDNLQKKLTFQVYSKPFYYHFIVKHNQVKPMAVAGLYIFNKCDCFPFRLRGLLMWVCWIHPQCFSILYKYIFLPKNVLYYY